MEERVEIHVQVSPGRHRKAGPLRRAWRRLVRALNSPMADAVLVGTVHAVLLGSTASTILIH